MGSIFGQQFDSQVDPYRLNGNTRDYMYFLVDGIYPSWSIFAKTIPSPQTKEDLYYKKRHEHVQKDIERAFGILVKKFHIIARPLRNWYLRDIKNILSVCIILHNMTVESRRDNFVFRDLRGSEGDGDSDEDDDNDVPPFSLFGGGGGDNDDRASVIAKICKKVEDAEMHTSLPIDLTHHLYHKYRQGKRNDDKEQTT